MASRNNRSCFSAEWVNIIVDSINLKYNKFRMFMSVRRKGDEVESQMISYSNKHSIKWYLYSKEYLLLAWWIREFHRTFPSLPNRELCFEQSASDEREALPRSHWSLLRIKSTCEFLVYNHWKFNCCEYFIHSILFNNLLTSLFDVFASFCFHFVFPSTRDEPCFQEFSNSFFFATSDEARLHAFAWLCVRHRGNERGFQWDWLISTLNDIHKREHNV